MVKPHWILAFGVGLAVGVLATRWFFAPSEANGQSALVNNPLPLAAETAPAAARQVPEAAVAPATAAAAAPGSQGVTPAAPAPPPAGAPEIATYAPPIDSGLVQPIDAGEVFNKHIARQSQPGSENQLGDAHRALEREPRDEAWAYTMEGELQNSMVNETSMGAFKMEHVECRSTICEIRLSGTGDQAAAVRQWSNEVHSNNFNQQLFINVSSTISGHDRVDAIYIFRKPPRR